jgi:predicted ATPase
VKKLQEIKFTSHPAFKKESTLTFFNFLRQTESVDNIPSFIFLAGENGSGKTSILDLVFNGLGKTEKGYLISVEGDELEAKLMLLDGEEYIEIKINVEDGRIKSSEDTEKFKVIYNKVDVSFKKTKITSATATTVDEKENPREESEDLSKVIPQLLVNIKTQDATYLDDYVQQHLTLPVGHTRKLDRFTDAFEKMFDGTKTFKTIKPHSGELKIIFTDKNGNEVGLDTFSTGEKQIIYRVGHLLKDLGNLNEALVLIDEPETSLHPKWQKKYIQFLMDVFTGLDIQFVIATHSPYILQGLRDGKSVCYKIDRTKEQIGEEVGFYKNMIGGGPSLNLINYKVFDIADELLHIELFAALEIKEGGYNNLRKKLEASTNIRKSIPFTATVAFSTVKIGDSVTESLPVSIRNKIHHADETARPDFSEADLRESIENMLSILSV